MKSKYNYTGVALTMIVLTLCMSCRKDPDSPSPFTATSNEVLKTITLAGTIKNSQGNLLPNATVEVYGYTVVSDGRGMFLFENINVPAKRVTVTCSHNVYGKVVRVIKPTEDINYITILFDRREQSTVYNAGSSATFITSWGSSIMIPANALLLPDNSPYSGNYTISATYLNPDSAAMFTNAPGTDFLTSDNRILYSYGMVQAEITTTSGTLLKMNGSAIAELTFPIASSQLGNAPLTLPLWHFNEETAQWEEQGTATRFGNIYKAGVTHFSWWNCDYPYDLGIIQGRVIDGYGNPMSNINVTVNNMYTVTTDNNGYYLNWIPSGLPIYVQVMQYNNPGYIIANAPVNLGAASVGQTLIAPDIIASFPATLSGNMTDCTGNPVGGLIYYIYNGSIFQHYSSTGAFNFIIPANASINMTFNYGNNLLDTIILCGAPGNHINMSSIAICNTTPPVVLPENSIYINGGPWNNITIPLDTTTLAFGANIDSAGSQIPFTYYIGTASGNHFQLFSSANAIGT
jgi:hypothetical protein